jgi:hypothetical protein
MNKREMLGVTAIALALVVAGFCMGCMYSTDIHECQHVKQGIAPKGTKMEYFLELQGDSAIVENKYGKVYRCHADSIPSVLLQDNL